MSVERCVVVGDFSFVGCGVGFEGFVVVKPSGVFVVDVFVVAIDVVLKPVAVFVVLVVILGVSYCNKPKSNTNPCHFKYSWRNGHTDIACDMLSLNTITSDDT